MLRRECLRAGIGSRLIEWAKGQSGGSLWLYTFACNAGAQAFYERHGFSIVARGHEPMWDLDDLRYEWLEPLTRGR
jgi:ribosomal protein S18 acetylase RimI-like enzyme